MKQEEKEKIARQWLAESNQEPMQVKAPAKTTILSVELNGNICLLTIQTEAFGKFHTSTRVYKRVK